MNPKELFNPKFSNYIYQRDLLEIKKYLNKNKGWIYIAKSKDNSLLKIGRTAKSPLERAKTLSTVAVLNDYEILFSLPVFNQFIFESNVHNELKRFNVSKEFFNININYAIDTITTLYNNEEKLLSRYFDTNILKEDLNLIEEALLKN